ncbi:hypothetical protein LTR94_033555, partial [Friedmanniomyces endolithicus]
RAGWAWGAAAVRALERGGVRQRQHRGAGLDVWSRLTEWEDEAPRGDRSYVRWTRTGIRGWSETDALKIIIKAPSVKTFDLSGPTELKIRGYDQPSLDLTLTGSSDVRVQGRTDAVTVDVSGAGDARMDELIVDDAKVRVSGSGE